MTSSRGYKCEFIDSVPDYLYCKKCTLVARKLNITSCCGESYCHVCITDIKKDGTPCPSCGENDYNSFGQKKNQKQIASLQVYCNMKVRGCDWSGTLEQLDTHLDPDQDNCQYVDTKCPLNCDVAVPKNEVEQHVAQHCAKRPYVCQHCNFKATYEEVVEKHLAECKYVPLQCPNLCGVTFERDFMEDHMKICSLEVIACDFSGVGCKDRFKREDQEKHIRENSQKHLALTASLAAKTKQQLDVEQEDKFKEEEESLKQKIQELEEKLGEQEKTLEEQEKKLDAQEKQLVIQDKEHKEEEEKLKQNSEEQVKALKKEQDEKLKEMVAEQGRALKEEVEQKSKEHREILEQNINLKVQEMEKKLLDLTSKLEENERLVSKISNMIFLKRNFEVVYQDKYRSSSSKFESKSMPMYTHMCGYKFCLWVESQGRHYRKEKTLNVCLFAIPGEYDNQLKWPAKVKFLLELTNQQGGENISVTREHSWDKPSVEMSPGHFNHKHGAFADDSELQQYLNDNGALVFCVCVNEVEL